MTGAPRQLIPARCAYLASLDDETTGRPATRKVSLNDPQSRWTAATGGISFFAYSTNYLIDTAHGIVLDVEATPANRTAVVESTKLMVDRVEERFDVKPERLIADTAYGSAPLLAWMVDEKSIEPHIPVMDKTERSDGNFENTQFAWDGAANEYRCPAGHALRHERRPYKKPRTHITKANTVIYRSSMHDCKKCPLKSQCCPNTTFRKIARSVQEHAREVARQIATTPEYENSRCERKKVEMLFAHLKSILKLDRLRLHGLTGATDDFTLAALAQDLRRMAKFIAHAPPLHRIGVPI